MSLENLLIQKKGEILKQWFALVIETYSDDAAGYYKQKKDHFANPVGSTIRRSLESIIDGLFEGADPETMHSYLDPIVRIRAIQNFKPSEAVSFVYSLKTVIRKIAAQASGEEDTGSQLFAVESRIDDLGLAAFDIYMTCREKIYDIKANEVRNRTFRAFERANLIDENPPE